MKYDNVSKEDALSKFSELLTETLKTLYEEKRFDLASKLENCELLIKKIIGHDIRNESE